MVTWDQGRPDWLSAILDGVEVFLPFINDIKKYQGTWDKNSKEDDDALLSLEPALANSPFPANWKKGKYPLQLCLLTRATGALYFVFCRLYPSTLQPPRQCLAPNCHISTLN